MMRLKLQLQLYSVGDDELMRKLIEAIDMGKIELQINL